MTASTKAASNGSTTTPATPATPERKSGMAHVREAEAYHTATVAHDAASEAERLCHAIYRTASGAYLRNSGTESEAAEVLAAPEMQGKVREAYDCLTAAQDYLRHLMACNELPF
jgi:hypothetical protein